MVVVKEKVLEVGILLALGGPQQKDIVHEIINVLIICDSVEDHQIKGKKYVTLN
jgi:hypothetical protein